MSGWRPCQPAKLLTMERRRLSKKRRGENRPGRNDVCPCASGKSLRNVTARECMDQKKLKALLERSVDNLLNDPERLGEFTSATVQTEWNLAHQVANEIHKITRLSNGMTQISDV